MGSEISELPSDYQQFIAISRYARWRDDLGRRETFEETVDRYGQYFFNILPESSNDIKINTDFGEVIQAIKKLEVMPSMRALMAAGEALDRDNVAGYNCAALAINRVRAFDELMYILMCGTGVGFSVERQYIQKLPEIAEEFYETDTTIIVPDSKIGWASSFRELLSLLYSGRVPALDLSRVRPAGARLKTFGGRASGPDPLEDLFRFSINLFREAKGRKLTSIECHDLICKIAEIVVVGGVRRSALISLSNLTDERMRVAKSGQWWDTEKQRALANNSVCYTEKPDMHSFMKEWSSLYDSKAGERGIFNRTASERQAARNGRRDEYKDYLTNPCSEIILRDRQFCNLTEVVVRRSDTIEDLKRKVRIATILGTLQASLTDFRYLSKKWKENTEEEALLGVSLTGIMDHPVLSGKQPYFVSGEGKAPQNLNKVLDSLREVAIETNKEWSKKLGINASSAITCVKPSGTVSQLVDSASGIHPRYSNYYIRTVRNDNKDPITEFLKSEGVPNEPALGAEESTTVFSFPMKAPDNAIMREEITAIQQLELWKTYQEYWCEHKPSITVYVREDEWMEVGAWVYKYFDIISGISFLPYDTGIYRQAPYQPITGEEYNEMVKESKKVDWEKLSSFESDDNTTSSHTLACSAGQCEL